MICPTGWIRAFIGLRHKNFRRKGVARKSRFIERVQRDLPCPDLIAKIFRFVADPNHFISIASHPTQRGVAQRHERGAGCGGRGSARALEGSQGGFPVSDSTARRRRVLSRTAKSCGPDASAVGVKSEEACHPNRALAAIFAGDGVKQARSPGRARRKPLKPLRAGMPGEFRWTCSDYARVVHFFPREAAGALGTRHSPRPPGRMLHPRLGRIAPRDRQPTSEASARAG